MPCSCEPCPVKTCSCGLCNFSRSLHYFLAVIVASLNTDHDVAFTHANMTKFDCELITQEDHTHEVDVVSDDKT